jgi:hypothetical protein
MQSLPMAPSSCSLDSAALDEQLARYRLAGQGAVIVERGAQRAVVRISERVPVALVDELIAVERACCPFFELDWDAGRRRLTVAVPSERDLPALELILDALGADPPPAAGRPLENPLHTMVIGATPPAHDP